jgi:hypothetical protein
VVVLAQKLLICYSLVGGVRENYWDRLVEEVELVMDKFWEIRGAIDTTVGMGGDQGDIVFAGVLVSLCLGCLRSGTYVARSRIARVSF